MAALAPSVGHRLTPGQAKSLVRLDILTSPAAEKRPMKPAFKLEKEMTL
jgi:hypothetical protein